MPYRIKPKDLQPGDVLLYHGTSFLARLIRVFDGTEYNHAAIYTGSEVVEALAKGLTARSIQASAADAEYVHVYRFLSRDGRFSLGSAEYPEHPVLDRVEFYKSRADRYAYEQILLLAILASTRRIHVPGVSWLLRNILDEAARVVSRLATLGKEPLICSELVYRCYSEAGDKYRLHIRGADKFLTLAASAIQGADRGGIFAAQSPADLSEAEALQEEAARFLDLFTAAKNQTIVKNTAGVESFSAQAVADFVTPGDLRKSVNLAFTGALSLA